LCSIAVIGSLTKDLIGDEVRLGGPAYYCLLSLIQLGANACLMCSVDDDLYREVLRWGAEVVRCGRSSPVFRLTYLSDGSRIVEVIREGSDLELSDECLELISNSSGAIIDPVIGEVNPELVLEVRRRVKFLSIDMQGFVRVSSDGVVKCVWGDDAYDVLKLADLIHLSIDELPPNTGIEEAVELFRVVTKAVIVISMDFRGSVVAIEDSRIRKVPALPGIEGYSTGTGDVMLAVMTHYLINGYSTIEAIALGTVAAGLRVRRGYPPWFTVNEVLSTYPKVLKLISDFN